MRHGWKRGARALALVSVVLAACGGSGGEPDAETDDAARVEAWLSALSLEEKVSLMHGKTFYPGDLTSVAGVPRLGIPPMWASDGPRGMTAGGENTAFPVAVLRAATWSPELERRVGRASGREARARGADILLAPMLNVLRHPRWGRAQESYGEDPSLIAAMGVAFIEGVQETVMACAKHFAVNSIEDTRLEVDVAVEQRALREVFLWPFLRAVRDGGVATVMAAYNSINGSFATENRPLLRDILIDAWQFDGFVMSDWLFAMHSTVAAAQAGTHLEMPFASFYGEPLVAAVRAGQVDEAIVDDAVRRMLAKRLEFGLDRLLPLDADAVATAEHVALAREVAEQGMVLLANRDGALPLDAELRSLAVVGRLADEVNIGDNGSSSVAPPYAVTPLAGIAQRAPELAISHIPRDALDDADAARVADADAAIVVVGFTAAEEGEAILEGIGGDRDSLALGASHAALVERVAALNPRTVVVLEGGSAVEHGAWLDAADALLMAWYPGMEGGTALAKLLFGNLSPSGRLPMAFPRSEADLPAFDNTSLEVSYGYLHGQRWLDARETPALFPLGFGLSYTRFEYAALELATVELGDGDTLVAFVELTNAGAVAGAEVVQLYVSYPEARAERAPRELRAFQRVELEPGETETVELRVPAAELARFAPELGSWVLDPGEVEIHVGPNAAELPLRASARVVAR